MAQVKRYRESRKEVEMPATRYVILKSKRNHNITIMYNGEPMILPPGGKTAKLEEARLGTLPSGVLKIPVP